MRKLFNFIVTLTMGVMVGYFLTTLIRCPDLRQYLNDNRGTILGFGGLLITSGIKTLPPPGTPFVLYDWLYDWSHQFFNLPNTRLNPMPTIVPPLAASTVPVAPAAPVYTPRATEERAHVV